MTSAPTPGRVQEYPERTSSVHSQITASVEGDEGNPLYSLGAERTTSVNDAIDFAIELAQRAADMRESDDWKDNWEDGE